MYSTTSKLLEFMKINSFIENARGNISRKDHILFLLYIRREGEWLWLTVVWPNPPTKVEVLENKFPPNPVDGVLNRLDWPKAGVLCPKADVVCPKADVVCPNGELVCPSEGVEDWNNGDDCVFPKLKLEANAGVGTWADEEPKIEVEGPNAEELEGPKSEGAEPATNAGLDEVNREGVDNADEPKGLEVVDVPKGEEPNAGVDEDAKPELLKAGVVGAKGLEEVEDEKRFADDCPNAGFEEDPNPEVPKPTAPVDWPAGAGPPKNQKT